MCVLLLLLCTVTVTSTEHTNSPRNEHASPILPSFLLSSNKVKGRGDNIDNLSIFTLLLSPQPSWAAPPTWSARWPTWGT